MVAASSSIRYVHNIYIKVDLIAFSELSERILIFNR